MQIAEIFYSIQGEGGLVGTPSAFIRTSGCNLRCEWCDTQYAWDTSAGQELSVRQILEQIAGWGTSHAVLTGGEPMIAAGIRELAEALVECGLHVTIETNATMPPNGIHCHLASLSPKIETWDAEPSAEQIDTARAWLVAYDTQMKFVISEPKQMQAVEFFLDRLSIAVPREKIFLMPQGSSVAQTESRSQMISELCKKHGYRYGQRLHLQLFGGGPGH